MWLKKLQWNLSVFYWKSIDGHEPKTRVVLNLEGITNSLNNFIGMTQNYVIDYS